jgi:hypothetical protein
MFTKVVPISTLFYLISSKIKPLVQSLKQSLTSLVYTVTTKHAMKASRSNFEIGPP